MKNYISTQKFLLAFFFGAFTFMSQISFAQEEPETDPPFVPHFRVSVALGASAYLGDLIQGSPVLKEVSPAASFGISYAPVKQFRVRTYLSILGVKGDDKYGKRFDFVQRNLNFKSSVVEFALLGEYDFINDVIEKNKTIPYIFAGPGVYHFNPTTIDKNGNKVDLHDLGTEGQLLGNPAYADRKYNLTQFNFQFGGGVRYKITETFTLGVEFSFRELFTDYLDDVSGPSYPSTAEFISAGQVEASQVSFRGDELGYTSHEVSSIRGNPDKKDAYYSFQIRGTLRID